VNALVTSTKRGPSEADTQCNSMRSGDANVAKQVFQERHALDGAVVAAAVVAVAQVAAHYQQRRRHRRGTRA